MENANQNNPDLRQQHNPIAFDIAIFAACIAPALLIGTQGLHRPYDAIPDQDLLWASEALRLLRGVAPSYADHPGAFWTLLYKLNIQLLELLGQEPRNTAGLITPEGINSLIQISRIQNAALAGLSGALVYPALWLLKAPKAIAAATALICSWSSATLVAVSEIRHESISMLFMLTYLILTINSFIPRQSQRAPRILAGGALLSFFAATLSKQQILLTFPVALAAAARGLYLNDQSTFTAIQRIISKLSPKRVATLCMLAVAPWLISASPDIDLINLPFWIFINLGLGLCLAPPLAQSSKDISLIRPLVAAGVAEIILLKLVIPDWWRQAVTSFPSWMFRHADKSSNKANQTLHGLSSYFGELFSIHSTSLIIFLIAILISFAAICAITLRRSPFSASTTTALAWLGIGAIAIACSQRVTSRYQVYFFFPLMILACLELSHAPDRWLCSLKEFRLSPSKAIAACSAFLIITAGTRSFSNAFSLGRFVNNAQPESFLCFGHHMDQSMALTSASKCPNFDEAQNSKNAFDNWAGPR